MNLATVILTREAWCVQKEPVKASCSTCIFYNPTMALFCCASSPVAGVAHCIFNISEFCNCSLSGEGWETLYFGAGPLGKGSGEQNCLPLPFSTIYRPFSKGVFKVAGEWRGDFQGQSAGCIRASVLYGVVPRHGSGLWLSAVTAAQLFEHRTP